MAAISYTPCPNCDPNTRRSGKPIEVLAAICLACPHLREHERAGLRCTHRDCRCGQGEQQVVEIAGRRFNGGLASRIQTGRCPAGKW